MMSGPRIEKPAWMRLVAGLRASFPERLADALPHPLLFPIVLALSLASCTRDAGSINTVEEDFLNRRYNHKIWRIDEHQLADAAFSVEDDGLAIRVPAAASGGKPAAFKSQFKLSGDFDISLEYSLGSFPAPEESSVNLGIWLDGRSGTATFRRTNQALQGAGFAMWDKPSEEGAKATWRFFPLAPEVKEARSELVVKRRGSQVQFLARASPDEQLKKLASLEYPSDVASIQFRVQAAPVSEPIEVRLHSIRVKADRILFDMGEPSWFSTPAGIISLVLLIVVGAAYLLLRNRPRTAS